MKTYQATGLDGGVDLVDVESPKPRADQVVVDVKAFSINRGELNQLKAAETGWRPGWDLAGTVSAAAADGSGPSIGSRIVSWVPKGAWSERAVVRVDQLAVLPDGVGFDVAAALPVAGTTARRILALPEEDLAGRRVFVTGGAGGVGSYAVVLAKAAGATVHAAARGTERAAYAKALGADLVVESIGEGAEEYDLILESAGGPFLAEALRRVKPGGVVVAFGNSSRSVTSLNIVDFYRRTRASLIAFALISPQEPDGFANDLEFLSASAAAGDFDAIRVSTRSWEDLPLALQDLESRAIVGKTVSLVG